ncbi:MAG: efflux RND transporter permease subunit [candidate division KSB1 bacterium]|nr:efflux RND transporter permease subunit [candidate division KSB1 bacterium]MDZ7319521.1 efflux RND transporter permease subunit [candidate division KSB1 bacterium]MDZ7342801.1 efflux RND transporter permease subunit [candidate division KSB1 bacterium]
MIVISGVFKIVMVGEGGEALQPLGAVVVGGLTTSTFLTLMVIPCVYSLLDRLSRQRD